MKLSRKSCKYAFFEFSFLKLVWISMFAFFNRFDRQIVLKSTESCFALHLFIGRELIPLFLLWLHSTFHIVRFLFY